MHLVYSSFRLVRFLLQVFATNFGEELMSGKSAAEGQVEVLQSAMWNLSDKSTEVCQRIVQASANQTVQHLNRCLS